MTRRGSRAPRAARCLLAVLATLAALGISVAGAGAQESTPSEGRALRLLSQTSWVGETGTFRVTVSTEGLPAGARLEGQLYSAVSDRAALAKSVDGEGIGTVRFRTPRTSVADLDPSGTGMATIGLPVTTSDNHPVEVVQLSAAPSVRPYAVRAYDGASEIASVVTHLVFLGPATTGAAVTPLDVNAVVPVTADATLDDAGQPRLDPAAADRLEDTVQAVTSQTQLPLTVLPSAEALRLLAATEGESGQAAVAALGARTRTTTLTGPYAPIDTGAWVASGLVDEMGLQYAEGAKSVTALLGGRPDGRTAVLDRSVTPDALTHVLDLGAESVIVPSDQLVAARGTGADAGFASRFALDAGQDVVLPAVAADSPTASRLQPGGDPVLAGHLALAELAMLQLGQETRGTHGVAVVVPPAVDPVALTTFLVGLTDTDGSVGSGSLGQPLVSPVGLDALQNDVRVATTTTAGAATTLTLDYTADDPAALGSYPDRLRDARTAFDGLVSLASTSPEVSSVGELLLMSGARYLDAAGRSAVLDAAADATTGVTAEIVVAPEQVVTLTSSSGQVPLNLENRLSVPATVRIVMSSAKLDFPEGSVIEQVLEPNTTTPVSLQVETRASGAFPLDVTITSADGALPVASTEYTVRSTAISGIGLALSIGAGLFLLIWWARHFRTARRARQLVGANGDTPAGDEAADYAPTDVGTTRQPLSTEGR